MSELKELSAAWLEAKEAERVAVETRRQIEDRMAELIEIPEDLDGTRTIPVLGEYKIKVVGRINHSIDSDHLQELAAEAGLSEHLSSLFRWKPEINMREWSHADSTITRALSGAITAKPGRPSFSIVREDI